MQFIDGVGIYVGLTRTRLHLHVEVQRLLVIAEGHLLILPAVGILLSLRLLDIADQLLSIGDIVEDGVLVKTTLPFPDRYTLKDVGYALYGQFLMLQS